MGVAFGIPDPIVDAVHDAEQRRRFESDHSFESLSLFFRQHLLRIPLAHGGEDVAEQDTALHEVHVAVKFQALEAHRLIGKASVREIIRVEAALIRQVVDGENGGNTAPIRIVRAAIFQQGGYQGALPVMAMDDGRIRPFPLHAGERAPGETREALRVVGKRPARVSVEPVPIEQLIRSDEFDRYTLVFEREYLVALIREDVCDLRRGAGLVFTENGAVRGQVNTDFVAHSLQRRRERAYDVAQPARFGEGKHLARHHGDFDWFFRHAADSRVLRFLVLPPHALDARSLRQSIHES